MRKTLHLFLLALVAFVLPEQIQSQCTTGTQYPTSTVTPTCTGTAQNVTTVQYAGEYWVISLTAGVTYTFSSSVSTDFITVATSTGTALSWGTTPQNYTPASTTNFRVYFHKNSSCATESVSRTTSYTCNPVPANNECANAATLTPGSTCVTTSGTTVNATQSLAAITCNAFTGNADDDVWYKFTAAATSHTVTVVGNVSFDAVVDVRSGSCNGTNIGCADATTGGGTEVVSLSGLTIGTTYLVRVYGYGTGTSTQGTFTICVTTPAPANDNCSGALTLTPATSNICGAATSGSTAGATSSGVTGCAGTADDDVWYQFVATQPIHIITVVGGSGFDPVLDVRSGACNGTNISCADATGGAGTESITATGLTVGSTYLIRIYDYYSGVSGTFTVCVTIPAAPANNNCSGATTLSVSSTGSCTTTTSGSTVSATQSIAAITCGGFTGTADDDVWYKFTAISSEQDVTVTGDGTFDAVVDVRSGACNGTNLACADATAGGGTEVVNLTGLTVGTQYLVRVYSYSSTATGTFTICITTPPPVNNDCSGARQLLPGATTLSGNTNGATQSQTGCAGTADDDVWFFFIPTQSTNVTLTATPVTGDAINDIVMQIFSGSCGALSSIRCDDDSGTSNPETHTFAVTAGTTYYVRVYSYFATVADAGTFTLAISPGSALPLDLLSFTGKTESDKNILHWKTGMERNVAFHQVERSADGFHWNDIGQVASPGDSDSPREYTLDDTQPLLRAYYRLRSVDRDASESVSPAIFLQRNTSGIQVQQAFPSPTKGPLTLLLYSPSVTDLSLSLLGMDGRLLQQHTLEMPEGTLEHTLDLSALPAGVYQVRITDGRTPAVPILVVKE